MRWMATLVGVAVLAFAAPARAAECSIDAGPTDYQQALMPAMKGLDGAAHSALGAQYAEIWFKSSRQGVDVGVAPGPLDLAGAQSAVMAALSPADAATLAGHVFFVAQPYGDDDLRAIQNALAPVLPGLGAGAMVGVACQHSDAFRVELGVPDTASPDQLAFAQNAAAPYGDRVLVVRVPGGGMTAGTVPASKAHVRRYVSLPPTSRCVHGPTIHLRLRAGPKSMAVGGKSYLPPHRVTVKLHGHRTPVTVMLVMSDGLAQQTFSFTRCGR